MDVLTELGVARTAQTTPSSTVATDCLAAQHRGKMRLRDIGEQIAALDEHWPVKKVRKVTFARAA